MLALPNIPTQLKTGSYFDDTTGLINAAKILADEKVKRIFSIFSSNLVGIILSFYSESVTEEEWREIFYISFQEHPEAFIVKFNCKAISEISRLGSKIFSKVSNSKIKFELMHQLYFARREYDLKDLFKQKEQCHFEEESSYTEVINAFAAIENSLGDPQTEVDIRHLWTTESDRGIQLQPYGKMLRFLL